jgi:ketosteroid isomerase-like protein
MTTGAPPDATDLPAAVQLYFHADARRDIDAILALFAPDATVVDEGKAYRGTAMLREWQEGPASRYEYRVTIADRRNLGEGGVRVVVRLDGNFPGGTATVNFDFDLTGDRIRGLRIAP